MSKSLWVRWRTIEARSRRLMRKLRDSTVRTSWVIARLFPAWNGYRSNDWGIFVFQLLIPLKQLYGLKTSLASFFFHLLFYLFIFVYFFVLLYSLHFGTNKGHFFQYIYIYILYLSKTTSLVVYIVCGFKHEEKLTPFFWGSLVLIKI